MKWRLARLERARPRPNGRVRGERVFLTTDGQAFLETTHCVFDHAPNMAILCANGEWPAFLCDKLINREELERIADGWQVKVRWLVDEAEG